MSLNSAAELGLLLAHLDAADVQPGVIDEAKSPGQVEAFKASGLDAAAYFAKLKTSKPHWFEKADPNAIANDAAAKERHKMAKAAAGTAKIAPTISARRAYAEKYGAADYAAMMVEYQGDHGMKRPGVNPRKKAKNETVVGGRVVNVGGVKTIVGGEVFKASDNPWSASFSGTPERAAARRLQIIRTGTARALKLCAAAQTDLAGRPLKQRT